MCTVQEMFSFIDMHGCLNCFIFNSVKSLHTEFHNDCTNFYDFCYCLNEDFVSSFPYEF